MLRTLNRDVRSCHEHAEACARAANAASTDALRADFLRLEDGWLTLARSYELSIRLSDFTAYQEQLSEKYRLELQESNMRGVVAAEISDVYITRELDKRPPGKVDTLREKTAL